MTETISKAQKTTWVKEALKIQSDIDAAETAAEDAAVHADELHWRLAEATFRAVKESGAFTNKAWATAIEATPSHVSQLTKVAETYGDPDYRVPDFSFGDHLELVRIPEDERQKVIETAKEWNTSVATVRRRLANEKKLAAARKADKESTEKEDVSFKAAKKVKPSLKEGGDPERNSLALLSSLGELSNVVGDIKIAVEGGGRVNVLQADEIRELGQELVRLSRKAKATESKEAKVKAKADAEKTDETGKPKRLVKRKAA